MALRVLRVVSRQYLTARSWQTCAVRALSVSSGSRASEKQGKVTHTGQVCLPLLL